MPHPTHITGQPTNGTTNTNEVEKYPSTTVTTTQLNIKQKY
jgi:hypothetical protein